METFSALLALSEGKPPVTDGFPSQKTSNVGFDFFVLDDSQKNKLLNKHLSCRWFETKWRLCDIGAMYMCVD